MVFVRSKKGKAATNITILLSPLLSPGFLHSVLPFVCRRQAVRKGEKEENEKVDITSVCGTCVRRRCRAFRAAAGVGMNESTGIEVGSKPLPQYLGWEVGNYCHS